MTFDEWWKQEWHGGNSKESERCRRVAAFAFFAGSKFAEKSAITISDLESQAVRYREALEKIKTQYPFPKTMEYMIEIAKEALNNN